MPRFNASPECRSIVMPVPGPVIRQSVLDQIVADGFSLKSEHHVTVIPSEYGRQLTDGEFNEVTDFLSAAGPITYSYAPVLYAINKPKEIDGLQIPRSSLVVPIASAALRKTIFMAAGSIDRVTTDPMLHVTLATRPDNPLAMRGIGIDSLDEWQEIDKSIYTVGWQEPYDDVERELP